MGRLRFSDCESIQGHFALMHSVPMDSQDHFRMIRSHNIAMPSKMAVTEFRQPLQVQIHLEMPGILVQLCHIQRT